MIESLFKIQKDYIDYFFNNINIEKANEIFKEILNCKGSLIFTGVGKSGIIANKLSTTMLSTGTRSFYISPMDALHGDMGIVKKDDIFIILSKSGNTKELISLLPHIRKKGAKIISLISKEKSKLSNLSDFFIYLPLKKELCPFNLSPTTSSAVQLIFGDILTVALMKKKNFSLDEYAVNHPSGSIGINFIKAKDMMLKGDDIPLSFPSEKIINVLDVLSKKRCGCIIAIDKNNILKGVFTDGDLRRAIEKDKNFLEKSLSFFMTKNPKYVFLDAFVLKCLKVMEQSKITILPVLDEKMKVQGIIRMHDIIENNLKN